MHFVRLIVGVMSLTSLCSAGGCLERKEFLTIRPDGGVDWRVELVTDSLDELYAGDAAPRLAGGWIVQEMVERDDDGKEKFSLIAEASFRRGSELPATYALKGQADASSHLQFPTQVRLERRNDGLYFHFSRRYAARPFADVEFLREKIVRVALDDVGADPQQWSEEQRVRVVKALARFEIEKMLLFGRAAFRQALPEQGQDGWLAVRNDLHAFVQDIDYQSLAKLIEPKPLDKDQNRGKDEHEQIVQAEVQKFQAAAQERLTKALRTCARLDGNEASAVMAAYDIHRKQWEVTEDLNDEAFEINVEMPGEIVGSNGDAVDGRTAQWKFTGDLLHDREIELMATSRIAK